MSMPFFGEEFTFTQPDGTTLQVKGWGNQERAIFETLDGFTVVRDPVTGYYQYADIATNGNDLQPTGFLAEMVSPLDLGLAPNLRPNETGPIVPTTISSGFETRKTRWKIRREIARKQLRNTMMAPKNLSPAPPAHQTVGDFVGLCLLVDFPDVPATIAQSEVENYCNLPGYNGFGNNGSVYDYFYDNSGGRLRYTNIVAPFYTARHPRDYYTDRCQPNGYRAQELIREALDHLVAQGFDFTPFTVDSDNCIYATNVFYAGPVVNNWSEGLWPHAWSMRCAYGLPSGSLMADYQITNMGNELTLGTFCHENGHLICDFPDLYDYAKDGFKSGGIGRFCLMCAGGNANKKNPVQVNAYLKFRAGWADSVTAVTSGLKATIQAGVNEFFIHRKDPEEYFILENRQKMGRDQALPGSGLAIWHIDESGDNEYQNRTSHLHYECSLEQADGQFELEAWDALGEAEDLYYAGGNSHFDDTTTPNSRWWDNSPSGLDISNISTSGDTMTFDGDIAP